MIVGDNAPREMRMCAVSAMGVVMRSLREVEEGLERPMREMDDKMQGDTLMRG